MSRVVSDKQVPGELVAEKDSAAVTKGASERMAAVIREAVAARGRATAALSGGNTPRDAYAALARAPGIDWSKVDVFWVDERAVPPTDDRSNYRWAKTILLDGANVPAARVHRMPAEEADRSAATKAYEKAILDRVDRDGDGVPAFDLMVLGVGDDGHTASLFPGEATVDVSDRFVAEVPARPGREARMTLTRPVLQHARHLLVLAVGAGKRPALQRAWAPAGDVHETPSRVIRDARGRVSWIVDEAAIG
jgi:6-phosphogluconolactonase